MSRPAFPTNLLAFQRQFSSDEACYEYVRDSRWPDGFRCPTCGHPDAYPRGKRKQVECAKCGYCVSVTAGTVMANTKVQLRAWLTAAWLMVTSKGGHSSSELERQIGVSHETAFTMLHKLRHAMVAPERTPLRGRVEVDESYVGGPEPGRPGRGAETKMMIVGAVEDRGDRGRENRAGRVRFRLVEKGDAENLKRFVREVVEPGSLILTDGHRAYSGLSGYRHSVASSTGDALRHYHIAVSNLKAWLKGTHHGRVEVKHLQAYLNEFAFRYNRRHNLAAAFQTMLGLSGKVGEFTYRDIYADVPAHPNPTPARRRAALRRAPAGRVPSRSLRLKAVERPEPSRR